MSIIEINSAVSTYLYGIASTNIWTEYLSIFLSDGILVVAICVYVFVILPLRKTGKYARTLFHDLTPVLIVSIVVVITKFSINTDRPFVVLGLTPFVDQPDPHASFPSYHVAVFAAFALTLVFHHRKFGIFLLSLLPFVMIGRIAIGVHWLTDVVGGAIIGLSLTLKYEWKKNYSRQFSEKIAKKYIEPRLTKYLNNRNKN